MDKFKFNLSSGRLQCLAEQGNTAWLRIHTMYFLNFFYGADLCLQSQKIAMELNLIGFETQKVKKGSYLGAPKQIINTSPTATQELL